LVDWLRSRPATLDPGTVELIYSAARRPLTWACAGRGGTLSHQVEQLPTKDAATSVGVTVGQQAASSHGRRIVVTYVSDLGLRLLGDPRPHQAVVKSAGFRWSNHQHCWYLPDSRGRAPDTRLLEDLAEELVLLGFDVEVTLAD